MKTKVIKSQTASPLPLANENKGYEVTTSLSFLLAKENKGYEITTYSTLHSAIEISLAFI